MPRKQVDNDFMVFPKRLTKLMKEHTVEMDDGSTRKMRQQDLADFLRIKRQTVSLYMSGLSMPDASQIRGIAYFFNVSADYLLGLSDSESLDDSVQSVHSITGLSESAINYLKQLKRMADNPPGGNTLISEYAKGRIALNSAFISDFGITGLIELYIPRLIRLRTSGLNEYEEKIFEDAEQAKRFYLSEAQNYLMTFLERFSENQNGLIEIETPDSQK
jgi:transcriptional regulator with XRE-family HTH domain